MLLEEVNVLYVDDVQTMRTQMGSLLRSVGFKNIVSVKNGQLAREHLINMPCHLILSDWHMAPVNGFELLEWVRNHSNQKETVFIMLSAEKSVECVKKAIEAGVDDYMVKPVSQDQVKKKAIAALLKKKVIS